MRSEEVSVAGVAVSSEEVYFRLGLTDAAIVRAARELSCDVLTVDVGLYVALQAEGLSCLNFAYLRTHDTPFQF